MSRFDSDSAGKWFGAGFAFVVVVLVVGVVIYLTCFLPPYKVEQFVDIGPNETAFLVPLEVDNPDKQATLSATELEGVKVKAKRVSLPLREFRAGRLPNDIKWIPSAVVRKVNRAPATRQWTHAADSGTTPHDEALSCETKDTIKLLSGVAIAATILEEDAARYLYHFGDQPLDQVLDRAVRNYTQSELQRIVKAAGLKEVMSHKAEHFGKLQKIVADNFKPQGIHIDYLGNDAGYTYVNKSVQASIDKRELERIKTDVALQRKLAQDVRNETALNRAKAENKAAGLVMNNKEALEFALQLDIWKNLREAKLAAAQNFKKAGGKLPQTILPAQGNGNTTLLQLNK